MRWESGRRKRYELEYRVRLTCGHTVKGRNSPMNDNSRYSCTSGLMCGYSLMWVVWWHVAHPEYLNYNDTYREETGDGSP